MSDKSKELVSSIWSLLKMVLHPKIFFVFSFVFAYVCWTVYTLHGFGLWSSDKLKDSLIWLFCFGFYSPFIICKDYRFYGLARGLFFNSLKLSIFVQVIIDKTPFCFIVELFLVPFVSVVYCLYVYCDTDKAYSKIRSIFEMVLCCVFIVYIYHAIVVCYGDGGVVSLNGMVADYLFGPMLSVCFLPCAFILLLMFVYENAFVRVQLLSEKSVLPFGFKLYMLAIFNVRVSLLEKWLDSLASQDVATFSTIRLSIGRAAKSQ